MTSRLRRLAPLLAALVVLSPLLRTPTSDTYPLSTYPMFAGDGGDVRSFSTVVGLDSAGSVVRLSPEVIAGTDEVVLASATIDRAIAESRTADLCRVVAARADEQVVEVVVRTETVDLVAHILDNAPALSIREHSRCEVGP